MSSVAIVVGINTYATCPLTSAVRDAERVAASLVRHGLVQPTDVKLLSSSACDPRKLPTRRNILAALSHVFEAACPPERLFFYFAGHGVLTFDDPTRNITKTAIATLDVADFERDGDGYIDFRALRDTFRSNGPAEQFFFLDACRNLAWKRHPAINPTIGFAERRPGSGRSQSVLYAVSQLGEALADEITGGYFTDYLLEALDGGGLGIEYDARAGEFVVTAHSIAEHVIHRTKERLRAVPLWRLKYMTPEPENHGPPPGALRAIGPVPLVPVTVHIEPGAAANKTSVTLGTGRAVIPGVAWPPNHAAHNVEPLVYDLRAESTAGRVDRARRTIDVRIEHEASVFVALPPPPPPPPGSVAEPSIADIDFTKGPVGPAGAEVQVVAHAHEPTVEISLVSRTSPRTIRTASGTLDEKVAPGAYDVRFRHGSDVYSAGRFVAEPGDRVEVRSVIERLEVLTTASGPSVPTKVISESIGPMQAGVAETALALIGYKPFDRDNSVAGRLYDLADWRTLQQRWHTGAAAVSIVLALEGSRWSMLPQELLAQTECLLWSGRGDTRAMEMRAVGKHRSSTGLDGARVGLATAFVQWPLWSTATGLTLANEQMGRVRLGLASAPGHVTVVTLLARADGSVGVAQYLLPGPDSRIYSDREISRWVRTLHIAQTLLARSGDIRAATEYVPSAVSELFNGSLFDPLLSVEILLREPSLDTEPARRILGATNVPWWDYESHVFSDIDVVHVLLAENGWRRRLVLERLEMPALLSTARFMARVALENGDRDARVLKALRRVPSGSLWLLQRDPPASITGLLTPPEEPGQEQSRAALC